MRAIVSEMQDWGSFIIPPIDAVYLKCPLLITDIPGHKEQMEDAALYFNGYNPEELAGKIEQLLADEQNVAIQIARQEKSVKN